MKKITMLVLVAQLFGAALMMSTVNAQQTMMPIVPSGDLGFLQFNNLTVESVSGTNLPAEIVASNPNIYPLMMGASSGGAGASAPGTPSVAPSTAPSAICYKFDAQNAETGQAVSCPIPKAVSPITASTTTGGAYSNMASPMMPPLRYQPYRIEIDASTRLLLRDRTVATLNSFSSGDQINVFGYYNNDGSIQAYLIRDLSKPAQDEFLQLNNVTLASISANTLPATLVVTQAQGYPCYGFGASGATRQSIACPMGIQEAPNNSALQYWPTLRKYMITVDAQTVILDNNRKSLSLSDLRAGDALNIYGDTIDNGQTLNADIVRDLSIPATPSTYSGTVTQVNSDGSFVIQTKDGQTITVQNPIQVGATIQLTGLLDRLKNVLTQVSNIYFGNNGITPPLPVMMPGMLRIQGSGPLPAGPGGAPNTAN